MMKSEQSKICIIGPSADNNYMGGVAMHIRNLKTLPCFSDAVVIDPGSIHSTYKTNHLRIIKTIVGLRKKIFDDKYSHVLINTSIYPFAFIKFLGILASFSVKNRPEIYVFFHGGRFQSFNSIFVITLNVFSSLLKRVKKFYFLSSMQLEGFQKIFPNYNTGLYSNYSTADDILSEKAYPTGDNLNLLFVGRIVKEKGVFELLSAINKVFVYEGNFRLVIVGDGPELENLVKQSEIFPKDLVHFTGYLSGDKLEDEYKKADVLILPSYQEGFPYTVIEAMRAGLPVISSGGGALDTLVQDGLTGFKVYPKNVDSIVVAIRKILINRNLLKEMSINCQRYFIEKLNKSAAEKFYTELVGAGTIEKVGEI